MAKLSKDNEDLKKLQLQLKNDSFNEEIIDKEINDIYREQKKAQDEVEKFIALLFVTYTVANGLLKPKGTDRTEIKNKSEKLLVSLGKKMGDVEVKKVTELLEKNTLDYANKSKFIYDLGGISINFKIQREEFINAIVNKKFEGKMFSDRIWDNKSDLIDSLHKEILNVVKGKSDINKASKAIRERFGVSAYESKRLYITELARIQSQAADEIAIKAGVEKQLFDATLDNKTSTRCRQLDGTTWNISDSKKPIPPLHPFCRSCLISLTNSWKFTEKMDNQNKVNIDYVKYNEWLKNNSI